MPRHLVFGRRRNREGMPHSMNCQTCRGKGYIECLKCSGTGKIDQQGCLTCAKTGQVRCPTCSASHFVGDSFSVSWDDAKKEYDVLLTFPRENEIPSEVLPELPSLITKGSMCSCGGQLKISSHSIERNQVGTIFRGKFVCTVCNGANRPVLTKVQESILSVWRSIKKIKVGSFEFEKNGQ